MVKCSKEALNYKQGKGVFRCNPELLQWRGAFHALHGFDSAWEWAKAWRGAKKISKYAKRRLASSWKTNSFFGMGLVRV